MNHRKLAAVSLIVRSDGAILTVYNDRYKGVTLPGGRVEQGETPEQAQARELTQHTELLTADRELVYVAPVDPAGFPDRASLAYVFRVEPRGTLGKTGAGSRIGWMARHVFVAACPFGRFYVRMFDAGIDASPTMLQE